jgi:hypothetical protein
LRIVYDISNAGSRNRFTILTTVGPLIVHNCGFQMGADRFAEQAQEQTGIVLDRGECVIRCQSCGVQDTRCGGQPITLKCCKKEDREVEWVREDIAKKAVDAYREKNHKIPQFWKDINAAAIAAVSDPGSVHAVGEGGWVKYTKRGPYLWCRLPSGRYLAYAKPQLGLRKLPEPWDDVKKTAMSYLTVDSFTKKWRRVWTYGGHLTENVVQATARDLMAAAMLRLDRAGYPIVMHTHDEIVAESDPDEGSLDEFLSLMKRRPRWAAGLPVRVSGWEGSRYRK